MRSFVALELPSPVKEAAAQVLRELKRADVDVKWVKPEALHVTLKFLGEVDQDQTPAIVAAMDRACAGRPALELAALGCGAFPGLNRPQVVWLGLEGQVQEMAQLAAAVEQEMAGLGFAPENRPFKAHVTLGRLRRGKGRSSEASARPLALALAGLSAWAGPAFKADRVVLMKSTLTPHGSIYDPVHVFTLAS